MKWFSLRWHFLQTGDLPMFSECVAVLNIAFVGRPIICTHGS